MTRAQLTARGLLGGTIAIGIAIVAVASARAVGGATATFAFLAAAAIGTELIQVGSDDTSFDPADGHSFSFSSPVHFAAAALLGPWTAALVAAAGVVLVDGTRGQRARIVLFNGSVFALAALSGGYAFVWSGGTTGALALPHDFLPLGVLVVVYVAVNSAFVNSMVALSEKRFGWRELVHVEASSRIGEAALGAAIVIVALREPWGTVALVPLVLAVYQGHARLARLRRETARALETFANVVDERDPYTYRHSQRVADYVQETAEELGLPTTVVQRLRWAGRLHDLGKIAVDASVLRKPGALAPEERAAIHRHPRLSARLLRRFKFAAEEARSIEYHHERFDGRGYYGVPGEELPLAAHFLVVADSYDAMTSDRPYRRGLGTEDALREIEENVGTQFHPAVARAFVAVRRGEDPFGVLTPLERAQLRQLGGYGAARARLRHLDPRERPEGLVLGGVVAGLVLLGVGWIPAAIAALAIASAGAALKEIDRIAARRLERAVRSVVADRGSRQSVFSGVVGALTALCGLRSAALVDWKERELAGSLVLSYGGAAPAEVALTSWFIRDAEGGDPLLVAGEGELGVPGVHVALPFRDEKGIQAFLVLGFPSRPPRRLANALVNAAPSLAGVFVAPLRAVPAAMDASG